MDFNSNNTFFHNNFTLGSFFPVFIQGGTGNLLDNGYPSGGNWWSNNPYCQDTKQGPLQDQPGSDGIGDTPYGVLGEFCVIVCIYVTVYDNYPFLQKNGWEIPPNQPPNVSALKQFKSDGLTLILEGATTTEDVVTFKSILTDPEEDPVKLQVEVRQLGEPFTGIEDGGVLTSDWVASGSEATVTTPTTTPILIDGQYYWRARAIDDKGNPSAWQEFGEVGNVDFEVKTVPLYTQVRSRYPSDEETQQWFDNPYAYATQDNPYTSCGWRVMDCGCAITSMVMLGRYYDIDTAVDAREVSPANINTWLTNNKGYKSDGSLWWGKAIEYLGFIDEATGRKMTRFGFNARTDYNVPSSSPRIGNFLALAKPIVANSKVFGHYFVIDGKLKVGPTDSTYTLKDPSWYNTKKLNQPKNLAQHIQGYNNRFDIANLFGYLETPEPITASMHIYLASPAELLIKDPLERKLGKDPIEGIVYEEITDSIYTTEGLIVSSDIPLNPGTIPGSKVVYIPTPIDGNYNIQVIGTDSGSYTMGILVYDQDGGSKDITHKGNTMTGDIQKFELNYSTQTIHQAEAYRVVEIDIKPGSYPNSINLKSKGVTPVAILTDQFFDTKNINTDTILFAEAKPSKANFEDVGNDNDLDLILHFKTQDLQLSASDTEAVMTGKLMNDTLIKGSDSIRIIGK